MQNASFDPGLTQQYSGPLRRAINEDGTFNVLRRGTDWHDTHPYLQLVSMPWWSFFFTILSAYTVVNLSFAFIYFGLGPNALQGGIETNRWLDRFLTDFFFSSQTLTTLGFGAIAPHSHAANLVATFEAFLGLLTFAVATSVLVGRVSKPSARIGFSERALMAPYQNGHGFQFRVVNRRSNALIEIEATLVLMTVDPHNGEFTRNFRLLKLERSGILFLPLTWTVVHPVDSESPLFGKTEKDLEESQAEFLVLLKAWDETFGQTVHQKYSYRFNEIIWNGKFDPAFAIDESGNMVLEIGRVGAHRQL